MKTRAASVRVATRESPAPQKRVGRKARNKRVLSEVPGNVGKEEQEEVVRAANHSLEDSNVAVQAGKGALECENVAVLVTRDSPARATGDGSLAEQQQQQQQQVLSDELNTAMLAKLEGVACDDVVGDETTVGEQDCLRSPSLARASALSTAIPDRAAVAGTTRNTRRASSFVLRQQQNTSNLEDQRSERRSTRCLSMGAAVASTTVPPNATPTSPVRGTSGAVLTTREANATAAAPPSEDALGYLDGSIPPAAEPAELAEPQTAVGVPAPHTGSVYCNEAAAFAFFSRRTPTAVATARRASIPCRRSEKHPAAIRRRPFSVGSSSNVAVLDGCLEAWSIVPDLGASSEKTGATEGIGPRGAEGYSGDRPLPASEEPATPPGFTGASKVPAAIGASVECGTPLRQQQQSPIPGMHIASASRGVASQEGFPIPPEEEEEEEEEEEGDQPSTPRPALFVLVDYATSPSASGSPSGTSSPLEASSLGPNTPSPTFCALSALAVYGGTVCKPRPSHQPLVEEGCPKLHWGEASSSNLDEMVDGGAPAGTGGDADEAAVAADPVEPSTEPVVACEEAELEEVTGVRPGPILSLEGGVGLSDEETPVAEDVEAVEVERAMVARVPVEGGQVEVPEEEPAVPVLAESHGTLAAAAVEDVANAAEGAPGSEAVRGTCALDEVGTTTSSAVTVEDVVQNGKPLEATTPDATERVPDELVLEVPASRAPSPGVEDDEARGPAAGPEETNKVDTETSPTRPAVPGPVPVSEAVSRSEGVNEACRRRPLRRSGRRRSIAALPAPAFDAALEREDVLASGAGVCGGQDAVPPESELPPTPPLPRRSGRRRSIAPRMPPFTAAPSPAPAPAPAPASAPALAPEPSMAAGADSLDLLLPEDHESRETSPPAAPSPVATATAMTLESSSYFAGAELGTGEDILPLESARPPRRSGRRRSIAPRMPPLTAAPLPAPSPSPSPAPAAIDPPAVAAAAPEPLLSAGAGSSDQDGLLSQEDREAAHPPARSGRRRSVAVLRRMMRTDGDGEAERQVPPPSAAAAAAAAAAAVVSAEGNAAAATATPAASASARDEIIATAEAEVAVPQGGGTVQQQQEGQQKGQQKDATRRRSRRRKSMRGVRAGGSLLEDEDASQRAAEEPSVQTGDVGNGGPGEEGLTGMRREGGREEQGAQATEGAVGDGGQRQTAVMADLLNKCMETVRAEAPPGDALLPVLASLSAALADAEACVLKHNDGETRAAADAGGRGRKTAAGQKRKKMVRLCAFDFSTVGMPLDTTVGSGQQAEEVVRCLERAIGAQQDLREALRGWSRGGGDGDAGRGSGPAAWRVLLRELRAAAAGGGGASAAREAGADPSACAETALEGGGGGGGGREGHRGVLAREKEASNAARVLLGELEPLERLESPPCSALRNRLASMLSSLIRFTLRIRLDAPPEKLTRAPEALPPRGHPSAAEERRRAEVSPPSHFSKVHKVVDVSDTDATLGAAFSKALLRLEGFSGEVAAQIFSAVESFEGSIQSTSGGSRFCEKDGCRERVESARQLVLATADVVDAVRARKFVLSLMKLQGVEEAIVEAGGWGSVERWASALKKLEGSADIDVSLTLLSDVEALKGWLRCDSSWGHAAERADGVLRRLLGLRPLKEVVDRARQRWMCPQAYQQLRQDVLEAQERFEFPEVKKIAIAALVEADDGTEAEPESVVEGTKASGGKGKQGRKKASACSAAPNKNKQGKSNSSKAGGGGGGGGKRPDPAAKDGNGSGNGKQTAASSSSSSDAIIIPRKDPASGSATTAKTGTADMGATTPKSKRKHRSSIE